MTIYTPNLEGRTGPKYRMIADAVAEDVRRGVLVPGTKLPTHRDLAYRVGVTVGTVTRAYQELQRINITGGRVGSGTYVRDSTYERQVFPADRRPLNTGTGKRAELAHSPVADGNIDLSMNRLTPAVRELKPADPIQSSPRHPASPRGDGLVAGRRRP